MQAHKLQVKVFAPVDPGVTSEIFIPIFHAWIKNRVLPELMIDVANYAHVPKGPGIVLIGHACDYFMDESDGRLGLLHSRKRLVSAPDERLADVFRRALHAAILLEREPALAGKIQFSSSELLFRINDRLAAPNTEATFAAVRSELEDLAGKMFAAPCQLERVGDPKSLFGVKITTRAHADLATLLARIGGSPV